MSLQITVLYDNRCAVAGLQEGWGFSAFIEFEGNKILFDTGADYKALFSNAEKLQISFEHVTHVFFSHRHADHINGFKEVIEKVGSQAKLVVPKTFPRKLTKWASSRLNTTIADSLMQIEPAVYSLVLKGGFWLYEQMLVLKMPQGLCIFTGCAHPGIITIIKSAQQHFAVPIFFVMGGFHLFSASKKQCLEVIKKCQAMDVKNIAPCHCSGDYLIDQFENSYASQFHKIGTGTILKF